MTRGATYLCPQHGAELDPGEKAWLCNGDSWEPHPTAVAFRDSDRRLVTFNKSRLTHHVVKEGED